MPGRREIFSTSDPFVQPRYRPAAADRRRAGSGRWPGGPGACPAPRSRTTVIRRVDEDARRCGGWARRQGRSARSASPGVGQPVRDGPPGVAAGGLVEVARRRSPGRRAAARCSLSSRGLGGSFGRVGGQVRAGHRRTGRRRTAQSRRTRRRAGAGRGSAGSARTRSRCTRTRRLVSSRLPSAGQAAGGDHQAEGRRASAADFCRHRNRRGPSCTISTSGREVPDHRRQRRRVVALSCGCCSETTRSGTPGTSAHRSSRPSRSLAVASEPAGAGRDGRRARSAAPITPAVLPSSAGRISATGSSRRWASWSAKVSRVGPEQQVAGLDHATADDQDLRVEDLRQVGQRRCRASARPERTRRWRPRRRAGPRRSPSVR